ncbi:MAG: hypothetical protein PHP22_08470 [Oscillospiraceae bacterium]|nr:hypothetical protein [Oscillospiraceae bacterium]
MRNLSIYFLHDSERDEYEATSRGCRIDVYVKANGALYNVRPYTIFTLQQDFERAHERCGQFSSEPNLIFVKDASKDEIIRAIIHQYDNCIYFNELKPVENIDVGSLTKVY